MQCGWRQCTDHASQSQNYIHHLRAHGHWKGDKWPTYHAPLSVYHSLPLVKQHRRQYRWYQVRSCLPNVIRATYNVHWSTLNVCLNAVCNQSTPPVMDSHTQMRLYDTSYTGLEADKWRFSIKFCDTPPISPCWLPITVCTVICTQMTPRFTAGPHRLMPARSKPTCRSASSTSRVGRPTIGCSWTHRRQSLFGALLHAVAITFPMETYRSATAQFIRSSQP